tara:strand:- start:1532 stop:1696 length:165 start_codon:yes stop_codon:yes gene_type:complete
MSNPVKLGYSKDSESQKKWEDRQRKVFSIWARGVLKEKGEFDIVDDLSSGGEFF